MSNQSCLFADDTPAPYNPLDELSDARGGTLQIAGAAYQIPAFWLFCFAEPDLVDVVLSEQSFSALVAPMSDVRRRLGERDGLARQYFPEHAELWSLWRRTVESVARHYLKLDPYEIWMLSPDGAELSKELRLALEWFTNRDDYQFTSLLKLAGIDDYDDVSRRILFDEEESDPEAFLIGWWESDEPENRPDAVTAV